MTFLLWTLALLAVPCAGAVLLHLDRPDTLAGRVLDALFAEPTTPTSDVRLNGGDR